MFNLANLLTAANCLSGVVAIILATSGMVELAPFAVLIGAVFDFFDGFAARLSKTAGPLGKQLDSLADMITFGAAPGVIMLVMLIQLPVLSVGFDRAFVPFMYNGQLVDSADWVRAIVKGESNYYQPLIALLIPFFALFRLAKFNIDERQTTSFIGLPTPAATLFFMSFPLALMFPQYSCVACWRYLFNPIVVYSSIGIVAFLQIAPIPLFSLKFKSFGWKGNEIRFVFLLISFVLIPILKTWSLALIVFLYLILSMVNNLIQKKKQDEVQSGN